MRHPSDKKDQKSERKRIMSENLKKFFEAISKDEALVQKVGSMSQEELLALGKELGIELTAQDFEQPQELSDDDLDAVAGGSDVSCACAMGGGGTKDTNDRTCACVLAGVGYDKNGSERCLCGFAGYGYDT
jgi:predicted ribosomally synthesized peptide with nif11-like leader